MTIKQEFLDQLKAILKQEKLLEQRSMINELSMALHTDIASCAAALLLLHQNHANNSLPVASEIRSEITTEHQPAASNLLGMKMVRYRLEVGSSHQLNAEGLKNILVEESGVDKVNIQNINIQAHYTIIELPDEMPIDIFQHLKTVTINEQPLAIKRLKTRNKRRNNNRFRRARQRNPNNEVRAEKPNTDL